MARSQQLQHLDPDTLRDLEDLRDTREEVLRELGREEGRKEVLRELSREGGREEVLRELGRKEGRVEIAQNLLATGMPAEQVATLTGLSLQEVQALTTS